MKNPLPENLTTITPANVTVIEGKANDIGVILEPAVSIISAEQKKNFSIAGQKKEGMMLLAQDVKNDYPGIFPSTFDTTKIDTFLGKKDTMMHLGDIFQTLANKCYDSATVNAIHASDQSNTIYGYLQMAAQHDSSLETIEGELGKYFQKGTKIEPATFGVAGGGFIEINGVIPGKMITNTGTSRIALDESPELSPKVKRVGRIIIDPNTAVKVPDGYTKIIITNLSNEPASFTIKLKKQK